MAVKRVVRWLVAALVIGAAVWTWRANHVGNAFFEDDPDVVLPLADAVAAAVEHDVHPGWSTGNARFDGEWTLVTCQMTVLGLGHVVQRDPGLTERYRDAITTCAAYLRTPEARAFATEAWGEDGLDRSALASNHGHAWLGWIGLAQAMAAATTGDREATASSHVIADALARRMDRLPVERFETYPGETYPPDLAAVVAAVALDGRHDGAVARFLPKLRGTIDPDTGLMRQTAGGVPRGSGTTLAAFFLADVDPEFSRDLATAARTHLSRSVVGFGGVLEVPRGAEPRQDVDSGPVIFGMSVSASGFGLAAARSAGDAAWHRSLYRTVHLVGAPTATSDRRWFHTGGTLGNAILLAMLTT